MEIVVIGKVFLGVFAAANRGCGRKQGVFEFNWLLCAGMLPSLLGSISICYRLESFLPALSVCNHNTYGTDSFTINALHHGCLW